MVFKAVVCVGMYSDLHLRPFPPDDLIPFSSVASAHRGCWLRSVLVGCLGISLAAAQELTGSEFISVDLDIVLRLNSSERCLSALITVKPRVTVFLTHSKEETMFRVTQEKN